MYISPMRDAIDAGLRPTNHTDFVVAPLDQMMMLWSAVNRVSRAGAEIGPDQRVTAFEGLKAMTEWVAEQYGEQDSKGTLEVGKARRPRHSRQRSRSRSTRWPSRTSRWLRRLRRVLPSILRVLTLTSSWQFLRKIQRRRIHGMPKPATWSA